MLPLLFPVLPRLLHWLWDLLHPWEFPVLALLPRWVFHVLLFCLALALSFPLL